MGRPKGKKTKKKVAEQSAKATPEDHVDAVVSQADETPVAPPEQAAKSLEGQPDDDEPQGDVVMEEEPVQVSTRKRKRGPTRMKDIMKDPTNRIKVDYTFMGEAYGPGSVKLSSYLGALVREHVPVTLEKWKKLGEDVKTLLWKSIQTRFEIDEEYQKAALLKQMGGLWRSSKSRLVRDIREADNTQQRNLLRAKNVDPCEWRKFVKLKTSQEFKIVSDSFKERRSKQIPFTCSRKGMVRLAEEMKSSSEDPSEVTRLKVWVKSRTRKDGTPVNTDAAEKLEKAAELIKSVNEESATQDEDALIQLLGPDNPGRMRAMGINMSKTKLACFQVKHKSFTEMQQKQAHLQAKVNELQAELSVMKKQGHANEVGENSGIRSVNKKSQPKCLLVDWDDEDGVVAEGRIMGTDPKEIVNGSLLGPKDVKVLVETATQPKACLWRPTTDIDTIEAAVGHMIAWPRSKCVELSQGLESEDIAPLGSISNSLNKCKLLDLSDDTVVVAEGRWQTTEPKALVNGLSIGPKGVKIFLDVVHEPEMFLWRPTDEVTHLEDCLHRFVVWPFKKVQFENPPDSQSTSHNPSTTHKPSGGKAKAAEVKATTKSQAAGGRSNSQSHKSLAAADTIKEGQKCKLMDISGENQVVAEGSVHSINPDQMVHFVRLGSNAARVWVNAVMVPDAEVWSKSDEMEYMKDTHGSSIAWPIDKLVLL